MTYRVRVTDVARQEMRRLPGQVRQRIRRLVEALAADPTPASAKELRGLPARYRVSLLDWRVIYRLDHAAQTIVILTVRRKTGPQTYQDIE
ncbi:MAG: type II toxin-antitoxin system RelE/ParE family toxin [Chloroflexi bacterium]|nr:type II toxin-antitoxin system RelE/ParE family toxin [Chloroflexota bacterium]MBI4506574.1 type II toxin-antitoxin system RelE/ParE family toxin [Chloroflexota bacterium]